ncbi:MAG: translation initiation factor IF-2 [Geminicoccaceae bacterium]
MSDSKTQDRNAKISLSRPQGKVEMKSGGEGTVRQSFSHGRSKAVAVEVKKQHRRPSRPGTGTRADAPAGEEAKSAPQQAAAKSGTAAPQAKRTGGGQTRTGGGTRTEGRGAGRKPTVLKQLTDDEKNTRARALLEAKRLEGDNRRKAAEEAKRKAEEDAKRKAEEEAAAKRAAEEAERKAAEEAARRKAEEAATRLLEKEEAEKARAQEADAEAAAPAAAAAEAAPSGEARQAEPATQTETDAKRTAKGKVASARPATADEEEDSGRGKGKGAKGKAPAPARGGLKGGKLERGRGNKIMLDGDDVEERRAPSLAAMRRRNERERRQQQSSADQNIVREVTLPETITVSELANRMAVRGGELVKTLMKLGIMATINQTIDADTAELVVEEMGHKVKRVSESDVEIGIEGVDDVEGDLKPRAPVVTVMGHVDHGKTSLLDAMRSTDVAAREAGGITQHIGAYQVTTDSGTKVAFIDTPGHAAFTSMRARGAKVTDIVILVVAADDGVMPQTIEAIRHAQAAQVPIIVAINKMDKPDADPNRVKTELLSYDLVVEDMGGEVQAVEVSAIKRQGLDNLIEAIELQAEILDLKANPARPGQGAVIEAKLDRGRGPVATVLVQKGTLRVGEIVVVGSEWGRVRALVNDRGEQVDEAGPSSPVEVLGLQGVPEAGDTLVVVEDERRGREISDYRQRKVREASNAATAPKSLEDMFSQIQQGQLSELPVVVKADVHGSLEAITAGLEKLGTDEVAVRVLHGGVGGITESDVTLALASNAVIFGFNVRANAQAREAAKRDGVDIRYYSIIYELLDDVKGMLSGMLSPTAREQITGHAEIRQVFSISKVGKVAGCMVIDGFIRRGCRLRLLRDDVVIYEGPLGQLKRFKDDVREVKEGFECGMNIEGYNDIQEGDVIEAYEVEEVARSL